MLRARSEISTGDDAEILKEILTGDEKGSVAGRKLLLDPGLTSCDQGRVTAKTNRRYTVTDVSH